MLSFLLLKTQTEKLKNWLPVGFYRRLFTVLIFGVLCLASVYTHLLLETNYSAYLLGLMIVYFVLFMSAPVYFRFLYPLKEQNILTNKMAHRLMMLLISCLYCLSTLIYFEAITLGADPYVCYVLLILIGVHAGAAPLRLSLSLIAISNGLIFSHNLVIFGEYFFVFLLGGQLVVLSLFHSLLSEFKGRQLLEISLAELSATQGMLRDIVEQETKIEVARNLHDEIGHLVTVVIVNLNRLLKMQGSQASPLLLETQQLTKQLMSEMRQAVLQLRSDDSVDLQEAIHTFSSGILKPVVKVEFQGFAGLCSSRIGEVIFRTCQESVTNVMRHSSAESINIKVNKLESHYQVDIEDNGICHELWRFGNGLSGLKERAENLLGTFTATSSPEGFRMSMRLPY